MNLRAVRRRLALAGLALASLLMVGRASADETIKGQVLGGGGPIANSKVTLYAATAGEPKQLAQTNADNEGRFEVRATRAPSDSSLYPLAFGGENLKSGAVATTLRSRCWLFWEANLQPMWSSMT